MARAKSETALQTQKQDPGCQYDLNDFARNNRPMDRPVEPIYVGFADQTMTQNPNLE